MPSKSTTQGQKKTQQTTKRQTKRGGGVIDIGKEGNAVFNASDLINKDHPWDGVLSDPMVAAMGYMPAPFSTTNSVGSNYMAGVNEEVINNILPKVGGAKKKTTTAKKTTSTKTSSTKTTKAASKTATSKSVSPKKTAPKKK